MLFGKLFLPLISLLALISALEIIEDAEFELRQLTEDNFRSSVSRGLWLVEHFSPRCAHCRAFAPTWTRLAEDKQYLERLSGFNMAQVNCLAQGDLCNSNGIKFYPQLILYADGQALPTYSGDRSYDDLSRFIDEQSTMYARGAILTRSDDDQEVVIGGDGPARPNPEGRVVDVDEIELQKMKDGGPLFVDFFAPWCGHCKKLRPIYEKLALEMKGKMNIVAVDCDAHNAFCRRNDVRGYPTLRLFHHDTQTEYGGPRSVDGLKKFAMKALEAASLQPIKVEDFHEIVRTDEAFFLYLQNFDTNVEDLRAVEAALEPLINSVPTYTSSDPLLYANLTISNPPPTSLLLAFSSFWPKPVGSLPFPATETQIRRFVNSHRFPTLIELSGANYHEVMKSDMNPLVVLAALHNGKEGESEKEKFMKVARAWKRGGRPFSQPVWFAWVDGEKWSGWLKQTYGIKKHDLPAVAVIDTTLEEYYDVTIEGNKVTFDGAEVFSVLEGVYQHFLRPKKIESTLEWGSRSATMTLISLGQWSVKHPFFAIFSLLCSVAVFVYLLTKCVARDLSHHASGYMNEKGPARLD